MRSALRAASGGAATAGAGPSPPMASSGKCRRQKASAVSSSRFMRAGLDHMAPELYGPKKRSLRRGHQMKRLLLLLAGLALPLLLSASAAAPTPDYYSRAGLPDAWSGGARMVEISTPKGPFHVWVKRVGHNPRLKVLLLHGGPAMGHDYLEAMDSFLPAAGIEYYYYDQLGAGFSDR